MIFAFAFADRQIVDAGDAMLHQAVRVEFPILIAVTAKPMTAVVTPFIGKAHGDAIAAECPQLLDQPVIEFAIPFARQEIDDGGTSFDELGTISPSAINCIGQRHPRRIAAVPGIFGKPHLLNGAFE